MQLTVDSWQLTVDSWQLTVDRCQLPVASWQWEPLRLAPGQPPSLQTCRIGVYNLSIGPAVLFLRLPSRVQPSLQKHSQIDGNRWKSSKSWKINEIRQKWIQHNRWHRMLLCWWVGYLIDQWTRDETRLSHHNSVDRWTFCGTFSNMSYFDK